MKKRIVLVCWNAGEAKLRASQLAAAGYIVEPITADNPAGLKSVVIQPPAAVVIDLGHLPSHGRDVGVSFRTRKATRGVPLVFIEGDPERTDRVRRLLPDAVFSAWGSVSKALRAAIARPPADPVVPDTVMAGYSGVPLPKKLGVKPGGLVRLLGAPAGFEKTLGDLPEGARLKRGGGADGDLTILFARTLAELAGGVELAAQAARTGGLWIAWPKKGSALESDLTQADVRRVGLAAGLVDFKICAIDATWSGLRFGRPRPKPEPRRERKPGPKVPAPVVRRSGR